MKDLFMKYGIVLGRRFNKRQKAIFAEEYVKDMEGLGYSARVYVSKIKFNKMANIVIGDIKSAKTVFVAGYDTGSTVLYPNYKYYPFNPDKNLKGERIHLLISALISVILLFGAFFVLRNVYGINTFIKIVSLIASFVLIFFSMLILGGLPNRFNYSRNSASIVLIRAIAEELAKKNLSKKVAFILCDRTVSSYDGYRLINNMLREEEMSLSGKNMIILDSLAKGETLVLASNETMAEKAKAIGDIDKSLGIYGKTYTDEKISKNMLGILENAMCMTRGKIDEKEFVVEGSRCKTDYTIDIELLEKIKNMFVKFIKNEK